MNTKSLLFLGNQEKVQPVQGWRILTQIPMGVFARFNFYLNVYPKLLHTCLERRQIHMRPRQVIERHDDENDMDDDIDGGILSLRAQNWHMMGTDWLTVLSASSWMRRCSVIAGRWIRCMCAPKGKASLTGNGNSINLIWKYLFRSVGGGQFLWVDEVTRSR